MLRGLKKARFRISGSSTHVVQGYAVLWNMAEVCLTTLFGAASTRAHRLPLGAPRMDRTAVAAADHSRS